MNKIFRIIWNHSTQTWTAVSELAKGRVKASSQSNCEKGVFFKLTILSLALLSVNAFAVPDGGTYQNPKDPGGAAVENYNNPVNQHPFGATGVGNYGGGADLPRALGANSYAKNGGVAYGDNAKAHGALSVALGGHANTGDASSGAVAVGAAASAMGRTLLRLCVKQGQKVITQWLLVR
ncbi:ESPR domain-containing protein [Pasteurellaceae bacterium 22721_9_1]